MVYDKHTLVVMHELTDLGKERYQDLLEREADELLWKSEHPVKAFFQEVLDMLAGN